MATRAAQKAADAIALLKADHDKVKKLFKEFERLHKAEDDGGAERIAKKICDELTIHTTVEEEIFYPVVRDAIHDDDMIDEAEVEHAAAKELIAQIEASAPSDDKYAAKVCVLGEYIDHHVEEEHAEMFPRAKRAKIDLVALGERISARKAALKAEMGIVDDAEDESASAAASRRSPPRSRARSTHAARH